VFCLKTFQDLRRLRKSNIVLPVFPLSDLNGKLRHLSSRDVFDIAKIVSLSSKDSYTRAMVLSAMRAKQCFRLTSASIAEISFQGSLRCNSNDKKSAACKREQTPRYERGATADPDMPAMSLAQDTLRPRCAEVQCLCQVLLSMYHC
jgi:hypothetical protein